MEQYVIQGGSTLDGRVGVSGSKNAALPIMAACLLLDGPAVLHRVPRLTDVELMAELLVALGMAVEWVGADSLRIAPVDDRPVAAPADLVRRMRGSVCVLGPLLARRGVARLPLPGGCVLGPRPIDLHVQGLRALGAHLAHRGSAVHADAGRLAGAEVSLAGPHGSTCLGTANVLMAATLARGRTVITSAAREPEVQDLARFLNRCGARIGGVGTGTLTVDGTAGLHGTEYAIIPDRIEAGTFLAAGALVGGRVTVEGVWPDHLAAPLALLRRIGARVACGDATVSIEGIGGGRALRCATSPYPGVPTDLQPQLSVLLCLARGTSTVREGVYPCRFTHAAELARMGADLRRDGPTLTIRGVDHLSGAHVVAADLRAGAAMVLAGLAARGETVVSGVDQIDRGYCRLEQRLAGLGARIQRRGAAAGPRPARKSA
jgi:UDP-N-acetylglucosamine 1-carboxyvinyltransferase